MELLLLLILIAVGGLPLLVWVGAVMLMIPVLGLLVSLVWYVFLLYGITPALFLILTPAALCVGVAEWRHPGSTGY